MRWLITALAVVYVICPYDVFPDFFIGVGWIDDLIILGIMGWYFYIYRKRRYGFERHSDRGDGPYASERGENFSGKWTSGSRKTPHSVLGVGNDASPDEIRRAYRRLANQYHPDKVQHLGEEFRLLAERRFREIQEAYQELATK
jgi:DnaJ-domain-containing protein 1